MTDLAFVGARVVDPELKLDAVRTIIVRDGVVAQLLERDAGGTGIARIDCTGMVLCPGFIDPHVHVREPGESHKETLATALAAAAAGGFTAVAAMPNTRPAMDDPERIRRLISDAKRIGGTRCYPVGAVTAGREGKALAPLRSMAEAGAVAFSDDGSATESLKTLYHAARLIGDLPHPMLSHCEDPAFAGALMHEGEIADLLGVPGTPGLAEASLAARDLLVAKATGKTWHLCHVSAAQTIDVLGWFQSGGVRATGEATPHHLQCTDELLHGFDARMRVSPPLRSSADVAALKGAVAGGVITIFASDHAPHTEPEKEPPLSQSSPGFSGLEVAIGAIFDGLPDLPLSTMVANFSTNVARLLNVAGGSIAPGSPADITGLYLNRPWQVDPRNFRSKGRVTPFEGRTFTAQPALTVVGGQIVYESELRSERSIELRSNATKEGAR